MRLQAHPLKALHAQAFADGAETSRGLVFTGERDEEYYTVLVHGRAVALPLAELQLLIDLVLARAELPTGFLTEVSPAEICRLRAAIDAVLGKGAGKKLIATGSGKEYRVSILPDELADQVGYTEPFFSN